MIWESFLDKTVESDVLKKNINTPQFAWLERKAETRTEEAKVETKKQKNIEAGKAPTDTENAALETEEAKNYAKEAKNYAEEAKVILLKTKRDYEEAIAQFKLKTERAKAIFKKHKEANNKKK